LAIWPTWVRPVRKEQERAVRENRELPVKSGVPRALLRELFPAMAGRLPGLRPPGRAEHWNTTVWKFPDQLLPQPTGRAGWDSRKPLPISTRRDPAPQGPKS